MFQLIETLPSDYMPTNLNGEIPNGHIGQFLYIPWFTTLESLQLHEQCIDYKCHNAISTT